MDNLKIYGIESFDGSSTNAIHRGINTLLKEYGLKHGLKLSTGTFTYGEDGIAGKILISSIFNSKRLIIGNRFKQGSKTFEILQINEEGQKVTALQGKRKWTVRFDQLAEMIKLAGYPRGYKEIENPTLTEIKAKIHSFDQKHGIVHIEPKDDIDWSNPGKTPNNLISNNVNTKSGNIIISPTKPKPNFIDIEVI